MFDTAGVDIKSIRAVVPNTRRVLEAVRRVGITVVYLKMAVRPDLSDAGAPNAPNWIKHMGMRA